MQNSKNLRHLFLTSLYFKVMVICDYSIDFHKGTCAYQGVRNVSFSENFAYVLNGWALCQLQNAKSNFPKFCKVYAQNRKTNLIRSHTHSVETIALIPHSKVVFKKLAWLKLVTLKNTLHALNPLIPRGNKRLHVLK